MRNEVKYNVTIYPVCKVRVCAVEAASMEEACKKAEDMMDWGLLTDNLSNRPVENCLPGEIEVGGYADEVVGYLVDKEGDPEFSESRFLKDGDIYSA